MARPVEVRAALALSAEVSIKAVGPKTIVHTPTLPIIPLMKIQGELKKTNKKQDECKWLNGKRVGFVGVPAEILGATKIISSKMTAAGTKHEVEYAFYGSVQALAMNCISHNVFLPRMQKPGPRWKNTGRDWKDYLLWTYVLEDEKKIERPVLKGLSALLPGIKDRMEKDEVYPTMATFQLATKEGPLFPIRIGVFDPKSCELRDPKKGESYPLERLMWRDRNGCFGPARTNPASWYDAQEWGEVGDFLPSSRWIPKCLTKEQIDHWDDHYEGNNAIFACRGKKVFFHLRQMVTSEKPVLLSELVKIDANRRPGKNWSRQQWQDFFEEGYSFGSSFILHFFGLDRGVGLRPIRKRWKIPGF